MRQIRVQNTPLYLSALPKSEPLYKPKLGAFIWEHKTSAEVTFTPEVLSDCKELFIIPASCTTINAEF